MKKETSGSNPGRPSALVSERIVELVALGMDARRAEAQAVAELSKGVLAPGCCLTEEGNERGQVLVPRPQILV